MPKEKLATQKDMMIEAQKKLESEIRRIAEAIQAMESGPLKRDVLIHLISWKSGVPARTVEDVLATISSLPRLLIK